MDKLLIPSPSNGIPFNWDDLDFAYGNGAYDGGTIKAIEGQLKQYGDNFIVSGCEVSGSSVAAGWVMLGGELIKVDAHVKTNDYYVKAITFNTDGNKQDKIAGNVQTYQQNRATATAASGNLKYDNRLYGSITDVVGVNYNKAKTNEIIRVNVGSADIEVDLLTGLYYNEDVLVVVSNNTGELAIKDGGSTLISIGINGSFSFKWDGTNWQFKDRILGDNENYGLWRSASQAENNTGTATDRTVTPDVNAGTLKYLSKTLTDGEDYDVAAKIGKIIIPSSVTEGSIILPASTNTFIGQQIHILSTGGSAVWVYLNDGVTTIISDTNLVANKLYILTWTGSTWHTTAAIDAPGTLIA